MRCPVEPGTLWVFNRGETCPLVPCMAGGSAPKNRKSNVARKLRISGMGVGKYVDPGKKIIDKPEIINEHLGQV